MCIRDRTVPKKQDSQENGVALEIEGDGKTRRHLITDELEAVSYTHLSQLNETVTSVQKYCNPAVKVRGILFTRFNPRANISRQMKELAEQLLSLIHI